LKLRARLLKIAYTTDPKAISTVVRKMQEKRKPIMQLRPRIVALVTGISFGFSAFAATAQTKDHLAQALAAVEQNQWEQAPQLAGPKGSVAHDVITWLRLRAQHGTPTQALEFIARNPDWPGLPYLRKQTEPALQDSPQQTILSFFAHDQPQTPEGALLFARALYAAGHRDQADALAKNTWLAMAMNAETLAAWITAFPATTGAHHDQRLNAMLWAGHYGSARAMLPLVSDAARSLAQARLALYNGKPGVDGLIAAIPANLHRDPGLIHARAVWRWKKGREAGAYELALEASTTAQNLGDPDAWAAMRTAMVREAMRDGAPQTAYRLAANHGLSPETQRSAYADLEWLAGFIALRMLDRPADAQRHFLMFDGAVLSPISKGRSGYWRGRAAAAMGDADSAYDAYAQGAKYQTSFYGLLAAEQIGRDFDPDIASPAAAAPLMGAPFLSSTVFQAGILLFAAGDVDLGERFLTHLTETLPADQAAQLVQMAVEFSEPHLAVMIAKRAANRGITLNAGYYPLHPVAESSLPMAPEMVLSIARRESEFNPSVRSHAGALGLMQVMPATGKRMANDIGEQNHSTDKMLSDWAYNARLGAEYLRQMSGQFNGNVVLMAAAYNAGPSRPIDWIRRFGDPRTETVDIVDWVEMIPYRETRNYVMRVSESLPAYRARLGQEPLPIPFSREISGATLRRFAP
jgi:soluble lytic murein transglycosylase